MHYRRTHQSYLYYVTCLHSVLIAALGNWRTGKCPKADWNEELMAPLRDQVQPLMDEFHNQGCDQFRAEVVHKVTELIDTLEEDMQSKYQKTIQLTG